MSELKEVSISIDLEQERKELHKDLEISDEEIKKLIKPNKQNLINNEISKFKKPLDESSYGTFDSLRQKVISELIKPAYYDDIKEMFSARYKWRKVANFSETFANVFTGVAIIISFATGFFNILWLAFVAGACSTLSLVFIKFAYYAMGEQKERSEALNNILDYIGVKRVPKNLYKSTHLYIFLS